jgi:E3 ubiquitin-protein ligase DOA10
MIHLPRFWEEWKFWILLIPISLLLLALWVSLQTSTERNILRTLLYTLLFYIGYVIHKTYPGISNVLYYLILLFEFISLVTSMKVREVIYNIRSGRLSGDVNSMGLTYSSLSLSFSIFVTVLIYLLTIVSIKLLHYVDIVVLIIMFYISARISILAYRDLEETLNLV